MVFRRSESSQETVEMKRNPICVIPDELRCTRSDKRKWRCLKPRKMGSIHCEYHCSLFRRNVRRRRQRLKEFQRNLQSRRSDSASVNVCAIDKIPIHSPSSSSPVIKEQEEIGITKWSVKSYKEILPKGRPRIIATCRLATEVSELDNLKDVLSMEAWKHCFTEAERESLRNFLPTDNTCDEETILKALLGGDDMFFGNPAIEFGKRICNGEMNAEVLLAKESNMKASQKGYFTQLKAYHQRFIKSCESYKQVFDIVGENPEAFQAVMKYRDQRLSKF